MAISQELENKQQMSGAFSQDNLQILNSANSQDSVSVGKKKKYICLQCYNEEA